MDARPMPEETGGTALPRLASRPALSALLLLSGPRLDGMCTHGPGDDAAASFAQSVFDQSGHGVASTEQWFFVRARACNHAQNPAWASCPSDLPRVPCPGSIYLLYSQVC